MATARKPKSGAKKKPAAKASKKKPAKKKAAAKAKPKAKPAPPPDPDPEKMPECYGDKDRLDPGDPECIACPSMDGCADEVALSPIPAREPEPEPEPVKGGPVTTDDLPKSEKKPPRRARPPVAPGAGLAVPDGGAVVTLLRGASDTPFLGGPKFLNGHSQTVRDPKQVAALKLNPRYSVVTAEDQ